MFDTSTRGTPEDYEDALEVLREEGLLPEALSPAEQIKALTPSPTSPPPPTDVAAVVRQAHQAHAAVNAITAAWTPTGAGGR